MKTSFTLLKLFDLFRSRLSQEESAEVSAELESSPSLRKELEAGRPLFSALETLRQSEIVPPSSLASDTMRAVRQSKAEEKSFFSLSGLHFPNIALAGFAALVLVAVLYNPESGSKVSSSAVSGLSSRYNDARVPNMLNAILTYIEGSFGALVMVGSFFLALTLAFCRKWKSSAAMVMVALVAFTTRSFMGTFYNDRNISDGYPQNGVGVRYNDQRIARGLPWPFSSGSTTYDSTATYNQRDVNEFAGSSRETYGQYEENPRFDTKQTPLSTFSIDVDTGSYSNMRRFINQGQLPPKESVRIEELVNYFDYGYPTESAAPFGVNYEIAPSPFETGRHLLRIGIKAKDVSEKSELGWNLVFLIDVSGSMSDSNKLPLVKEALKLFVQRMRSIDRVAIVTYAGQAGVMLPSTPGSEKARISSAIDSLEAGGSTNGSSGIALAYQQAEANRIQGSVNRVILATDGDFNVGISSFDELMKLIERKRSSGVTLTTLGFGEANLKEQTMEQLADRGNGNYFYIDSFREARKVLETNLAANMQVVAKDVKLQVEFNPEAVKSYRLIGFDNRKLRTQDFKDDAKDAGEIGSGHTVTAIYELTLVDSPLAQESDRRRYGTDDAESAQGTAALPTELGFLKIRFKEPEGKTSREIDTALLTSAIKHGVGEASNDFLFASGVAYFGEILRQSQYLGNYGMGDVLRVLHAAKGEDPSAVRAEFIKLVEDAKALRQQSGKE